MGLEVNYDLSLEATSPPLLPTNRILRDALEHADETVVPVERISEWLQHKSIFSRFSQCIHFYGLPSKALEKILIEKHGDTKLTKFTSVMSSCFDLDQLQAHDLYQEYIRDCGGSDTAREIKMSDNSLERLVLVRDYYFDERMYLLYALQEILRIADPSNDNYHPYFKPAKECVKKLLEESLLETLIVQYEELHSRHIPDLQGIEYDCISNAKNKNALSMFQRNHQISWVEQCIREQVQLLEALLILVFTNSCFDVSIVSRLSRIFNKFEFSASSLQLVVLPAESIAIHCAYRIPYLNVAMLLACFDLETLLSVIRGDIEKDSHPLLRNSCQSWKQNLIELNEYLTGPFTESGVNLQKHAQCTPHGTVLLGWATFLKLAKQCNVDVIDSEDAEECASLANSIGGIKFASQLNTVLFGDSITQSTTFFKLDHPSWEVDDDSIDESHDPDTGMVIKRSSVEEASLPGRELDERNLIYKAVMKELLSGMFKAFEHLQSIRDINDIRVLTEMTALAVQGQPGLAIPFFGEEEPLTHLLRLSAEYFPYRCLPLLRISTALSSCQVTALHVFNCLGGEENLYSFTQVLPTNYIRRFDNNSELSIESGETDSLFLDEGENTCYEAVQSFVYEAEGIVIPAGSTGSVIGSIRGDVLIKWNIPFSPWKVFISKLHSLLRRGKDRGIQTLTVEELEESSTIMHLINQLGHHLPEIPLWLSSHLGIIESSEWLKKHGFHDYISLFATHNISLGRLTLLTDRDLECLGISSGNVRQTMLFEIRKISQQHDFISFGDPSSLVRLFLNILDLFHDIPFGQEERVDFNGPNISSRSANNSLNDSMRHLLTNCLSCLAMFTMDTSTVSIFCDCLLEKMEEYSNEKNFRLLCLSRQILRNCEEVQGVYSATLSTMQLIANIISYFVRKNSSLNLSVPMRLFKSNPCLSKTEFQQVVVTQLGYHISGDVVDRIFEGVDNSSSGRINLEAFVKFITKTLEEHLFVNVESPKMQDFEVQDKFLNDGDLISFLRHITYQSCASEEKFKRIICQCVHYTLEVFTSYETWRYDRIEARWNIGISCMKILRSVLLSFTGSFSGAFYQDEANPCTMIMQTFLNDPTSQIALLSCMSTILRPTSSLYPVQSIELPMMSSPSFSSSSSLRGLMRQGSSVDNVDNAHHHERGFLPVDFSSGILKRCSPIESRLIEFLVKESLLLLETLLLKRVYKMDQEGKVSIINLLMQKLDLSGGAYSNQVSTHISTVNFVMAIAAYLGYKNLSAIPMLSGRLLIFVSKFMNSSYERAGKENRLVENQLRSSAMSFFQNKNDAEALRSSIVLHLKSQKCVSLRITLLDLITVALEFQPGFAGLLFNTGLDSGIDNENNYDLTQEGILSTVVEILQDSDKIFESDPGLLSAVLRLLCALWDGAAKACPQHNLIVSSLRKSPEIWSHISYSLDKLIPRNIKFMASHCHQLNIRAYALRILASECHYRSRCGEQGFEHPLMKLFEEHRKRNLYSQWLNEFRRFDYNPEVSEELQRKVHVLGVRLLDFRKNPKCVVSLHPNYGNSFVFNLFLLKSRFSHSHFYHQFEEMDSNPSFSVSNILEPLVSKANREWSLADSQMFLIRNWRIFIEVCCLQPGRETDSVLKVKSPVSRKNSLLLGYSPEGQQQDGSIQGKKDSQEISGISNTLTSRFAGDRTSFGMIRALGDSLAEERRGGFIVGVVTQTLSELFVSMLHHQLCSVLKKTVDPGMSKTIARSTGRLDIHQSLLMLCVLEKACNRIFDMDGTLNLSNQGLQFWKPQQTTTDNFNLHLRLRLRLVTSILLLLRHLENLLGSDYPSIWDTGFRDNLFKQMSNSSDLEIRGISGLRLRLLKVIISCVKFCDYRVKSARNNNDTREDLSNECDISEIGMSLFNICIASLGLILRDVPNNDFATSRNSYRDHLILLKDQEALTHLVNCFRESCLIVSEFYTKHTLPADNDMVNYSKRLIYSKQVSLSALVREEKHTITKIESLLRLFISLISSTPLVQEFMLSGLLESILSTPLFMFLAKLYGEHRAHRMMSVEPSDSTVRGYLPSDERDPLHRCWCLILELNTTMICAIQDLRISKSEEERVLGDIIDFIAHFEPVIIEALRPRVLTLAGLQENQCIMQLILVLSKFRSSWKLAHSNNFHRIFDSIRSLFSDYILLLGDGSNNLMHHALLYDISLPVTAEEKLFVSKQYSPVIIEKLMKKIERKRPCGYSVPTMDRRSSLRVGIQQDSIDETLSEFHVKIETYMHKTIIYALQYLIASTPRLRPEIWINGVRKIDMEAAVPILDYVPHSMISPTSPPSLGHLCICVRYCFERIKKLNTLSESIKNSTNPSTQSNIQIEQNLEQIYQMMQSCAHLLTSNYILHEQRYQHADTYCDELSSSINTVFQLVMETQSTHEAMDINFLNILKDKIKEYPR